MSEVKTSNGLAVLLSWLQPGDAVHAVVDVQAEPMHDHEAERAAAFEAGVAAGRAAVADELAPTVAALRAAEAALQAACRVDIEAVQPLLAGLVRAVAERVLDAELRTGATVLQPLVAAALAEVQPGEGPVLRAHPDTMALIEASLGDMARVIDAGMLPGVFQVEGPEFVIAAGLAARLDALMEALA